MARIRKKVVTRRVAAVGGVSVTPPTTFNLTAGSYAVTGDTLLWQVVFEATAGAYSITGDDLGWRTAFDAAAGSYAVTGDDMQFAVEMDLAAASYVITGYDQNWDIPGRLAPGAYAITGHDLSYKIVPLVTVLPFVGAAGGLAGSGNWQGYNFVLETKKRDGRRQLTLPFLGDAGEGIAIRHALDRGSYALHGADMGFKIVKPRKAGMVMGPKTRGFNRVLIDNDFLMAA